MRTTLTSPSAAKTRARDSRPSSGAAARRRRRPPGLGRTDTSANAERSRHERLERRLRIDRDRDGDLARRDDVDGDGVPLEDGEDARRVAVREEHPRAPDEERRRRPSASRARARPRPAPRPGRSSRRRAGRNEFLTLTGSPARDRRADRRRVEDLRAEERELGRLGVADLRDEPGARDDARVGRQDAVHVGPDLDRLDVRAPRRGARRRGARPSSPSRRARASSSRRPGAAPTKPPVTTTRPGRALREEPARDVRRDRRLVGRRGAVRRVRREPLARVDPRHGDAALRERGRRQRRREELARRAERVGRPGRELAEERDAGGERVEPRQLAPDLRAERRGRVRPRARGRVERRAVALPRASRGPRSAASRSPFAGSAREVEEASVTPPIAETTTNGSSPSRAATSSATPAIRSAGPDRGAAELHHDHRRVRAAGGPVAARSSAFRSAAPAAPRTVLWTRSEKRTS